MKSLDGFKGIDFNNQYFVDKNGNVYSSKSGHLRQLKGWIRPDGYRFYGLAGITESGHRLVCWAYLGECPAGKEVGHIDGVKDNNKLSNLRYVTSKENQLDKVRHGTQLYGEKMTQARLKVTDVLNIYKMLDQGYSYSVIANKYSVHQSHIGKIKCGQRWASLQQQ